DENVKLQFQQRWLSLNEEIRTFIKQNAFNALYLESMQSLSATLCFAYIAVTELPHMLWPNLIELLTQNVTNPNITENMKEATLEAI
ncbi:importin subunit beta-1-like isoform X2, partial [Leptotrombidium deliense]